MIAQPPSNARHAVSVANLAEGGWCGLAAVEAAAPPASNVRAGRARALLVNRHGAISFDLLNPRERARLSQNRRIVMNKNEGAVDRTVRVVLGVGLLSLSLVGPQTWWGLVGLVPLLTGVLGYCPAYGLVGLSTCPVRGAEHS